MEYPSNSARPALPQYGNSWTETTPLVTVQEDPAAAAAAAAAAAGGVVPTREPWNCGRVLYSLSLSLVIIGAVTSMIFTFTGAGAGKIPIASDTGVPFVTAAHPLRPTALWGKLPPPYPTGAWFTNMVHYYSAACDTETHSSQLAKVAALHRSLQFVQQQCCAVC
jgi:hypothetical protein